MGIFSLVIKPLAYISLPVLLLRTLAQSSPIARYYVRVGMYVSMLAVCSAWGALISLPMSAAGARFNINWVVARTFELLAGATMNLAVDLEGDEHLVTRPAIFVSNHQSMLDILYLGRCAYAPASSAPKLTRPPFARTSTLQNIPPPSVDHGEKQSAVGSPSRPVHDALRRGLHRSR